MRILIVEGELNVRTAIVQTGDSDWIEFTPTKTGSFEYYCSVGNHKAMGMFARISPS